jgi:hypothetical protein
VAVTAVGLIAWRGACLTSYEHPVSQKLNTIKDIKAENDSARFNLTFIAEFLKRMCGI